MHYRKIYSILTGLEVPKDFEIHHIDFDRKNNDIKNLVALPKKLHRQYHFHLNIIKPYRFPHELSDDQITNMVYESTVTFIKVHRECMHWITYRDFILMGFEQFKSLNYAY
jgi:hypothetical protein